MTFKYWISTITAFSVALAMAGNTTALRAEEAADTPQSAWDKCIDTLENMPDDWTGWRRDFHNGYADSFEFYNSDGEYDSPAVLVTDFTIDDTAYETVTSCFEGGKLSYVKTIMRSANTVGEAGTQAERHGGGGRAVEHFPRKWAPVSGKDMRKIKELKRRKQI